MRNRPLPLIGQPHLAALALAMGLCLGLAPRAEATESVAAQAAIAKLLSLPAPGSESAPSDGNKRALLLSQRGENLDRMVRRAWPKHPFKDEFVRKAFVQLNPEALAKNPGRVLPAGTALAVPTAQDLQALLAEHYPAMGIAAQAESQPSPALAAKRRWVHYP